MRRALYLAWGIVHFTLIAVVCTHDTCWLLKRHLTITPASFERVGEIVDKVPSILLDSSPASRLPLQEALATYTNAAGIDVGYGYFAPNIPPTHALVFECHYPDGRVEYQTPTAGGDAAQFRVATLIEQIGQTDYDRWRIALIKLLARSTWQRHPDAVSMRAFFGTVTSPTVPEYRAGKRERTFDCLYVYDFRREAFKGGKSTL